jgi:hypothetical protein
MSMSKTNTARTGHPICVLLAIAFISLAGGRANAADLLAKGAKDYKPFAVERIQIALASAKDLQAAVKAGDVKAAQAAWIKSRKGWEAAEPITGEFFPKLDEAIDATDWSPNDPTNATVVKNAFIASIRSTIKF